MATYVRLRYLLQTTDPVHIGTGGYRLGRVDNAIVRDPGTRLPKIPGTSLHGAIRAYAAYLYGTPAAAGQKHDAVEKPDENPICYTFGYIKKQKANDSNEGEEVMAYSGVVNIFDAHILLFPVYSMVGPIWVSTAQRLKEAGFSVNLSGSSLSQEGVFLTWERKNPLNLGWLMLPSAGRVEINAPEVWSSEPWNVVKDRLALVSDALFSQIVNSNLEVRTSVSIDPETGAAEEGALFTYEAIPRATFLTMEAIIDDYRGNFPKDDSKKWSSPADVLTAGLCLIEWLGVGGMGTRGFGRIALVGRPKEQNFETLQSQYHEQLTR
ncbi:MAG: type III-B CRISPR module RAMP protein Cmr4 [Saprospiraceae bacterium]|nr:type III-B CRISPR module RAMP protein Cmr4 [Saprospiraceae bacterium]MDW8484242.1 type III-B CRISPR module RAMP protein Cmr4 [Saprospiraceae bacterium]